MLWIVDRGSGHFARDLSATINLCVCICVCVCVWPNLVIIINKTVINSHRRSRHCFLEFPGEEMSRKTGYLMILLMSEIFFLFFFFYVNVVFFFLGFVLVYMKVVYCPLMINDWDLLKHWKINKCPVSIFNSQIYSNLASFTEISNTQPLN